MPIVWEYCEVENPIGFVAGRMASARILMADGSHRTVDGEFGQLVARLGQDGWEIATAAMHNGLGSAGQHAITYLLKRPAP